MSSFLCFVCHSTVNADTNEDTREKYREVIGMNLCPDSHLCFICCYFLNKMCLFKSICLKRSLEYPVLFSEKGTINLQRSDITVAILCPEDICLQHLNTRYHFYNNSENSQSDFDDNNYCDLQDERNFDNDGLLKTKSTKEFHNEDYLFTVKDNVEHNLFNEELLQTNLEPVRIIQNDLVNGEWTKNESRNDEKRNNTVLLELHNCKYEIVFEENVPNVECTEMQEIQEAKLNNSSNSNVEIINIEYNANENDKDVGDKINIIIEKDENKNVNNNINDNVEYIQNEIVEYNVNLESNTNENEEHSINGNVESNINEHVENNMIPNVETNIKIDINEDGSVSATGIEILDSEDTDKIQNKELQTKKPKKSKKKDFLKVELSVKEQKMELEQARRDKKYIEATFKCHSCAMSYHFKDTYQAHMMRHEESNGEYRCAICSLRFANPAVHRKHIANHTLRFKCTRCEEVVRARQRPTHARRCRGKEGDSASCHLCGHVFQGASNFQQHLKRYHQEKTRNRSYLCSVCGKSCHNRAAVRTHMLTHINRKFCCDQCTSTFSSPYTLNQHRKKHTTVDQELHFCPTCKVGYNTRKSLLAHRRNSLAHKETVYKCSVCDRSCPSLRSLQSHEASVHVRTKHLTCALCPAAYSTRKALVTHMSRHRNEGSRKTPLCHACGEKFKSTSILKRHLRNVCEKNKIEEELGSYFEQ